MYWRLVREVEFTLISSDLSAMSSDPSSDDVAVAAASHEAPTEDEDKPEAGQSIQEIMAHLKEIKDPSFTASMLKESYDAQREVGSLT